MKAITLAMLAIYPSLALAAAPPVPELKNTPCLASVKAILKADYTSFKVVDGNKIGVEFIDASNFTKLPTLEYFGMGGKYHFGLVGYARIDYMGDATSHLYNYTVSASCVYNEESKKYELDDGNLDGKLNKEDISLQSMDFER